MYRSSADKEGKVYTYGTVDHAEILKLHALAGNVDNSGEGGK
jgi:hypothetical protein